MTIRAIQRPVAQSRRRQPRRGVAAVELAVCAPIIVLVIVATLEATNVIFLQQSLSIAAYESARVALTPQATTAQVTAQCNSILGSRGVRQATVTVTPGDVAGAARGSWIQVQTRAPVRQNSLLGGWLFANRTLQASAQVVKER